MPTEHGNPLGRFAGRKGGTLPFGLTLLGDWEREQWQTEKADFFQRYIAFEKAIHAKHPEIQLIGLRRADITSERYTSMGVLSAGCPKHENFVYAADEHYYVKPQWFYEQPISMTTIHGISRSFPANMQPIPVNGMNRPEANIGWCSGRSRISHWRGAQRGCGRAGLLCAAFCSRGYILSENSPI